MNVKITKKLQYLPDLSQKTNYVTVSTVTTPSGQQMWSLCPSWAELSWCNLHALLFRFLTFLYTIFTVTVNTHSHSSVFGVCSLVRKRALTESSRWSITDVSNSVSCTILTLFRVIQENKHYLHLVIESNREIVLFLSLLLFLKVTILSVMWYAMAQCNNPTVLSAAWVFFSIKATAVIKLIGVHVFMWPISFLWGSPSQHCSRRRRSSSCMRTP